MSSQYVLAPRAGRADAHAPTDALRADAGVYADAVARVFPRPHAAYFAAEPARRRAIRLAAQGLRSGGPSHAEALATWSLRRLVEAYLPLAPQGLAEALRKLDGDPWSAAAFQQLSAILEAGGDGLKVLRHAPSITERLVGVLAALPSAFRRPRIVAQVPTVQLAELAARGAKRLAANGEPLAQVAERLDRARSTQGLFRMLIDAIGIEQLAPPPIPGADWLRPIATSRDIEMAALRFENCLRGRIPLLLAGTAAYYEALGDEPAVVEIVRDAAGLWVVGEVRGHANGAISEALWRRIRGHLEQHGARVSFAKVDQLALALAQAAGW